MTAALTLGIDHVAADPADALDHVDGRKMPAIGKLAIQPKVTIRDSLHRIRNRLIEIVTLNQHRVEPGD